MPEVTVAEVVDSDSGAEVIEGVSEDEDDKVCLLQRPISRVRSDAGSLEGMHLTRMLRGSRSLCERATVFVRAFSSAQVKMNFKFRSFASLVQTPPAMVASNVEVTSIFFSCLATMSRRELMMSEE